MRRIILADRAEAFDPSDWPQIDMYLLLVIDFSKTRDRNRNYFLLFYMYPIEIYDVFEYTE
jgi:hypothetical protein